MVVVLVRTIFVYIALILMMRLMGKRQIGELEISELITTLLLSEVASLPITNHDIPIMFAIIPIITIVTIEIVGSVLLIKFPRLKNLLSVRPNVLIKKGHLQVKELRRIRMSTDELISSLRQNGITSLDEVLYAIVEENGKISVIPKAKNRPLTPEDLNQSPKEKGISHILISDGHIDKNGLQSVGLTEENLRRYLGRQNKAPHDIFLMLADDSDKYTIILKETRT